METEQEAREITNKRLQLQREQSLRTTKTLGLDDISHRIALGEFHELNIIVKGDTDGSIEALSDSFIKLSTEKVHYAYDAPINIAPFRAYYNTTQANGAKLSFFTPVFEEGEGDVITAIAPVAAVLDVDAPVYDLQGRMVAPTYRKLKGKKLAAGMYVVNGVKIIVK